MGIPSPKAMGVGAAIALAASFSLAACGSDENPSPTETAVSLRAATAERLAERSEEIADQLDSGDTCGAAHSADDLDAAVADADIPAELRPEIEAASEELVNSVNCPPPPEPKEKKKGKGKEKGEDHGDDEGPGFGPPGHEGDLPPGQEKKYKDAELIGP
ncbi:MAG: hypothetical protein ACRDK5_02310 [Solirubrobacterales bacterium]